MSRESFKKGKVPELRNPAEEIKGRIWEAHAAYQLAHKRTPTQGELAEFVSKVSGINVDQTTVGTWFKGTPPRVWFFREIAAFYGVRLMWLMFGEGKMLPAKPLDSYAPADATTPTLRRVAEEPQVKKKGRRA